MNKHLKEDLQDWQTAAWILCMVFAFLYVVMGD